MPIEFELTEQQQQIKRMVREFAEAEIKPRVMEWDEAQHFPKDLFPKMGALGLMGVIVPEEYGGAGMGYIEYATIIEELARVDGDDAQHLLARPAVDAGGRGESACDAAARVTVGMSERSEPLRHPI